MGMLESVMSASEGKKVEPEGPTRSSTASPSAPGGLTAISSTWAAATTTPFPGPLQGHLYGDNLVELGATHTLKPRIGRNGPTVSATSQDCMTATTSLSRSRPARRSTVRQDQHHDRAFRQAGSPSGTPPSDATKATPLLPCGPKRFR
jgi:hypothetical protein